MTVRTTGERIAERFVTAIALGQFVPGQRLPTERELAAMLSVSRATVREAIARLRGGGVRHGPPGPVRWHVRRRTAGAPTPTR